MNALSDHGTMVISLDFELLWGLLDTPRPMAYKDSVIGGRKAVPAILALFEKYRIHATWGVVGLMARGSIEECRRNQPAILPDYCDVGLSSYSHFDALAGIDGELLFAGDLIGAIKNTPYQEIGSHTYSHFYCLEAGQKKEAFDSDLEMNRAAMCEYAGRIKSIILPRNQYNPAYADILKENGLKNYRGNENTWFNRPCDRKRKNRLLRKCTRLLDNYLDIFGHHCYPYSEIKNENGLNNIRSSRFFRPYTTALRFLEPLRIRRIKKQMRRAAKGKMVFHLWWHPHNFGTNTEQNLKNLESLLQYYEYLNARYRMQSLNMGELGDLLE